MQAHPDHSLYLESSVQKQRHIPYSLKASHILVKVTISIYLYILTNNKPRVHEAFIIRSSLIHIRLTPLPTCKLSSHQSSRFRTVYTYLATYFCFSHRRIKKVTGITSFSYLTDSLVSANISPTSRKAI